MAKFLSKLNTGWTVLLRPAPRVSAPDARNTALIAMRAVVVTIGAGMLAVVATIAYEAVFQTENLAHNLRVLLSLFVIGFILYELARRGYDRLSLRLLIAIALVLTLGASMPTPRQFDPYGWTDLIYLVMIVLPIILAGMLLSGLELFLTTAAATIGAALLGTTTSSGALPIVIGIIMLFWSVAIMSYQLRWYVTAQEALRQAELAEKNAIFTLVERYSKDIIVLINPDMTIRYVTPNATLLTTRPLSEVTGQSFIDPAWTQFLNPERMDAELTAGVEQLLKGQDIQGTVEFKREDGRLFRLDISTSLIREGDVTSGAVMILRDITERKQAEDALKRERNLLRTLIDNLPDYVYVMDRDQQIMLSNHAASALYGTSEPDAPLSPAVWEERLTPDAAALIAEENARVLGGEVIIEQEREVELPDGQVVTLATTKVPLHGDDGTIIGLVGRTRDITQQKRAQQQALEQAMHQEQLSAALQQEMQLSGLKTIFMNLISHEFRTPLSQISMAADMIDRYHDRMTAEARSERLAVIAGEVKQLQTMLDDITTVLQMQSGSTVLMLERSDAAAMLQKLIHDLVTDTGRATIELNIRGDVSSVRIDRRLFRYIARNLIGNALKYSPDQAPIAVELTRIDDDAGSTLILTVRDQGIGMDEETRSHMFEPFYRGENAKFIPGTGLGLKIVHDCVLLQNGSIDVESAPGQGTTITVRLPLSADES